MFWIIAISSVVYLGIGGYHATVVRNSPNAVSPFVRNTLTGVVILLWLPILLCASLDGLVRKILPEKPKKEKLR